MKRPIRNYRLTKDIVIPAGAEVSVEPPKQTTHHTDTASVLIEVTPDVTAYWYMDLEEAIDEGIIEEVPDDPAA